MPVTFRLPHLAGAVLIAAAPFAGAESPTPDPVAPAVIGRPLDQIRPARVARTPPAVAKPRQAAGKANVAAPRSANATAAAPLVASVRPPTAMPASPAAAAIGPAAVAAAPATVQQPAVANFVPRQAEQAPRTAGGYFSARDHELVHRYYRAYPPPSRAAKWKVGDPVPMYSKVTGVPDDVRAALPALPRGHEYVEVDGQVVLLAVQSRVVVDAVPRTAR